MQAPEVQRYIRVEHKHTVEHTTPLWRLVAVVAMFGGLGAIGHYLDVIGHTEDAATILSITIVYTLSFWAARRPDSVDARFGPFSKIARAVRESQDDIRTWVRSRTLLAGVLVAIGYGIGLVIIKHVVLTGLRTLWSPWLAVAGGCIVGALVIAPELWRQLAAGTGASEAARAIRQEGSPGRNAQDRSNDRGGPKGPAVPPAAWPGQTRTLIGGCTNHDRYCAVAQPGSFPAPNNTFGHSGTGGYTPKPSPAAPQNCPLLSTRPIGHCASPRHGGTNSATAASNNDTGLHPRRR